MLLAGDIGGTKTLLGLFSRAPSRPAPLNVQSFPTAEYGSLVEMVDAFLARQPGGRPVDRRRVASASRARSSTTAPS